MEHYPFLDDLICLLNIAIFQCYIRFQEGRGKRLYAYELVIKHGQRKSTIYDLPIQISHFVTGFPIKLNYRVHLILYDIIILSPIF